MYATRSIQEGQGRWVRICQMRTKVEQKKHKTTTKQTGNMMVFETWSEKVGKLMDLTCQIKSRKGATTKNHSHSGPGGHHLIAMQNEHRG